MAAGVATGGVGEAVRYGVKQGAKFVAMLAPVATKPDATVEPAAAIGQTEEEKQRQARLMADRRRREFQNLGRSSTILTGPGGLAGSGAGRGNSLLGG